jgi:hypothetical protein
MTGVLDTARLEQQHLTTLGLHCSLISPSFSARLIARYDFVVLAVIAELSPENANVTRRR